MIPQEINFKTILIVILFFRSNFYQPFKSILSKKIFTFLGFSFYFFYFPYQFLKYLKRSTQFSGKPALFPIALKTKIDSLILSTNIFGKADNHIFENLICSYMNGFLYICVLKHFSVHITPQQPQQHTADTHHHFSFVSSHCCSKPLIRFKLYRFLGSINSYLSVVWQGGHIDR